MGASPLAPDILFHIGPVPISRAVATTWAIIAFLMAFLRIALRHPSVSPGPVQAALEIVVTTITTQLREILGRDPWPFLPILGSLFIFLVLVFIVVTTALLWLNLLLGGAVLNPIPPKHKRFRPDIVEGLNRMQAAESEALVEQHAEQAAGRGVDFTQLGIMTNATEKTRGTRRGIALCGH